MKWIKKFYDYCTWLGQQRWALPFLGLFSFAESIFFPLPVDPLLVAVCASRPKSSIRAGSTAILSSVLGACVGFALGHFFSLPMKEFLLQYILNPEQWNQVQAYFKSGSFFFIFIGGFTPLPFKVFAISAGLLHGAFIPFLLGALLGRTLRFGSLALLFYFYGGAIKTWIDRHFEKCIWGATAFIIVLSIIYFMI